MNYWPKSKRALRVESNLVTLRNTVEPEIGIDRAWENSLLDELIIASPENVELQPQPIPDEWILSGAPVARSRNLSRSRDLTSSIVVWDCTAGRFRWHYDQDETILIVSGEAFMMNEDGEERRFGPGDVGFFPAGTTRTWRVTHHIRKVAVLRENLGRPLGFCLKAWKKLLRSVGLGSKMMM